VVVLYIALGAVAFISAVKRSEACIDMQILTGAMQLHETAYCCICSMTFIAAAKWPQCVRQRILQASICATASLV
jgi:hypothetical protein